MNYNEYLEQRNALMTEIENLIEEGKIEESNAKWKRLKTRQQVEEINRKC